MTYMRGPQRPGTRAVVAAESVAGIKVYVNPIPSKAVIVKVSRAVGRVNTVVRHGSTSVTEKETWAGATSG